MVEKSRPTLGNCLSFNEEIGLHSFDRPRSSCVHATSFCHDTCYKWKAYRIWSNTLIPRDARCEVAWQENDVMSLKRFLVTPSRTIRRVRMFSRGEGFAHQEDIGRASHILKTCKETEFMWPTRAWRDPALRPQVRALADQHPNLYLLASTDIETTQDEWQGLVDEGWWTMFYGNDTEHPFPGVKQAKCPKSWVKLKEHCAICKLCFSKRFHIWMKQH